MSVLPVSVVNPPTFVKHLETLRFKDKNDYEYESWIKVFLHIFQKIDTPESFVVLFFFSPKS